MQVFISFSLDCAVFRCGRDFGETQGTKISPRGRAGHAIGSYRSVPDKNQAWGYFVNNLASEARQRVSEEFEQMAKHTEFLDIS